MKRHVAVATLAVGGSLAAMSAEPLARAALPEPVKCRDAHPAAGRVILLDRGRRVQPYGGVVRLLMRCPDGTFSDEQVDYRAPSDVTLKTVTVSRGGLIHGRATSHVKRFTALLRSKPIGRTTLRLTTRRQTRGADDALVVRAPRRWGRTGYLSFATTFRYPGYRKDVWSVVKLRLK